MERVLALGDGKAVLRYNDDALMFHQQLTGIVDAGMIDLALERHHFPSAGRLGAVIAKDDARDVTVHGVAHDLG